MLSEIEVIIFDLEGTLVENKIDFLEMKKEILSVLKEKYNINLSEMFLHKRVVEILDFLRDKLDNKKMSKIFEDISKIADKYELVAAKNTVLKRDIKNILSELKKRNIKLALLTNDGKLATEQILNKFNLKEFFDIIITRDDMNGLKPNPVGIEKIIKTLNVPKEKCVLVGDSKIDIEAANNAGIIAIGVLGGFSGFEELEKSRPHAIIKTLKELLDLDP
ncbi:MAG: HAD family hydrolase [Candidatus Asgardarchaeia archaeon]